MNMGNSIIDFNEKKGFICDMDGVIYHGNQILLLASGEFNHSESL